MLNVTGKVANRFKNLPLRLAQIFLRCVALRPRTPVAEDAWPRAPSCFSEFRRLGRALQRRIEKDVKARVVRHQRCIADERLQLVCDRTKQPLVGQELGRKPVHRERVGWHSALRADVAMKRLAR